jgi:hypothetical protein
LSWAAPLFDGGSEILDYSLYTDEATGTDFVVLEESLTTLTYTATSLTQGATYKFKVKARNIYGDSVFSETVTILAAQVPAQPVTPVTTWIPNIVVVTWVAPDDGGSPITGYKVTIVENDGVTYSAEQTNCDMTASTEVSCTITVAALKAEPFSLDWGTSVFAKVVAVNQYGDSVESEAGNGAVITTTPDVPTNVAEVYEQRTKSTLGLSWVAPVFTGGAVIEDYRINIAEQGQAFSVLASGVTDTAYLATGLTFGVTYEFKIESRNSYGYSGYSETITLLCAFKPDPPLTASTANSNALVTIAWGEPIANGSPITAYKILVEEKDTGVFTQEAVDCDGTSADVVSTRQCTIQLETLRASPYNLVKDDSVNVKIVSVNFYGDSLESVIGSGAVI